MLRKFLSTGRVIILTWNSCFSSNISMRIGLPHKIISPRPYEFKIDRHTSSSTAHHAHTNGNLQGLKEPFLPLDIGNSYFCSRSVPIPKHVPVYFNIFYILLRIILCYFTMFRCRLCFWICSVKSFSFSPLHVFKTHRRPFLFVVENFDASAASGISVYQSTLEDFTSHKETWSQACSVLARSRIRTNDLWDLNGVLNHSGTLVFPSG